MVFFGLRQAHRVQRAHAVGEPTRRHSQYPRQLFHRHDADVALGAAFFDVVDGDASEPGEEAELGLA